jgi:hypothetical protein
MLDVKKLSPDVRNALNEDGDRVRTDEELQGLSLADILSDYLQWEGIIGYTKSIMNIIRAFGGVKD